MAGLARFPDHVLEAQEGHGALEALLSGVVMFALGDGFGEVAPVEDAAAFVVEGAEAESLDEECGCVADAFVQGAELHECWDLVPCFLQEVVQSENFAVARRRERVCLPGNLPKHPEDLGLVDGVCHGGPVGRWAPWRQTSRIFIKVVVLEVARDVRIGLDALKHTRQSHVEGHEQLYLNSHIPHPSSHLTLKGGDVGQLIRIPMEAHLQHQPDADSGENVAVHLRSTVEQEVRLDIEQKRRQGRGGGLRVLSPDQGPARAGLVVSYPVEGRHWRVAFYFARVDEFVEEDAEGEHHEELGYPV